MSKSMPPPPTDTPVSGAGSGSTGDQLKNFLVNFTGGGMPGVRKQLDDAHAQRVAEAERQHRSYGELSQVLSQDKEGKYHNPDGSLNPDGQKLELQRKQAFDAWNKAAGVNKESKSIIGRLGQITDKLVHHRAAAQGQGGQGQMPQPPAQGMPSPPAAAGQAGPSGGGTGSATPNPPNAAPAPSQTQLAPPPGYTPAGQDPDTLAAQSAQDAKNADALDLYKKQGQVDADLKAQTEQGAPKRMVDGLVAAGFSKDEALKIVQSKLSGAAARPKSVFYTDPSDPTRKLFGTEVGGQVFDQNGDLVPNASQIVPSMLPSMHQGEMPVYNPDTHQFDQQPTFSTTQKVAPKAGGAAKKSGLAAPGSGGKSTSGPSSSTKPAITPTKDAQGRHGIPARQFNPLQKQATAITEARNSLIGDDPEKVGGIAGDLEVFKRPKSVKRLSEYLGLVTSTMENEAKQVTGQGPMAAAEWYLGLPQAVVELQQGALADASKGLDDGAPDGPEHQFVADYFRNMGTIGGLRASTGASSAKWSFNTLRSELPTPGPVTSYDEAKRRVKNMLQETNVVAKFNPMVGQIDPSRLDPKGKLTVQGGKGTADAPYIVK